MSLKNVINKPEIANIVQDFQKEYESLILSAQREEKFMRAGKKSFHSILLPAFFAVLCFTIVYAFYGNLYVMASYRVQSDLIIPHKKVLLERDDIVSKMDTAFTSGIKSIALVGVTGIGGAGKTVLARYYAAFSSDAKIVWELNAEKKETLMQSFQDLAWALTQKNSARKKELDAVISIQNTEEKQKQLLLLVKAWLKAEQNWLLIYDSVDNIADIKDYLPQDQRVWGSGRVII